MNRYSDIIGVNTVFQNSVNISFDLNSEEKIREYIPTRDTCSILDGYVKTVLGKSSAESAKFGVESGHSTILLGPYGKGKSFLVLVLLFILSCDEDNNTLKLLLEKIKKVDNQLSLDILELKKNGIRLLPIVINSDYDNLSQAFTIAINESLLQNHMDALVPKTAYDVCLEVIDEWEQAEDGFAEETVEPCAKKNGIDYQGMKAGLHANQKESYEDFRKLYNCVIRGLPFNPLVKNDVVSNVKSIAASVSQNGYSGLFFVFDEFSKFIEGNSDNLGSELNLLQTVFEAANGSKKNSQIHLCCITHKPLALYAKGSSVSVNAFRTVEGRVKEVRFTRSIGENTQLLAYSIKKKKGFEEFWNLFYGRHKDFYDTLTREAVLPADNCSDLIKGCFPLNPISVRAAISLSEKVAQNERTLFTFVSDNDRYSVNTFIHNHCDGFLNLPWIYDYFTSSLEKESDRRIKSIWYRCESCLKRVSLEIERDVLKSLAVLEIAEADGLLPNDVIIAAACNLSLARTREVLSELVDASLIRRNAFNNLYMFASVNSGEVDNLVNRYIVLNQKSLRIRDIISQIAEMKYCVSREYNARYKMTRFLKVVYMLDIEVSRVASFDSLVSESVADGILLRIVTTDSSETDIAVGAMAGTEKVIIQFSSTPIDDEIKNAVLRYAALTALIKKYDDETVLEEMRMQLAELKQDLNNWIKKNYNNSQSLWNGEHYQLLQKLITKVFERSYCHTPIINNELINKQEISVQYAKARNNVIDRILNHHGMEGFSETSPEMTVYNAVFPPKDKEASKSIQYVCIAIKQYLTEGAESEVKCVEDLIKHFGSSPYGIRFGVMPLLLAVAVAQIPDHLIIYKDDKEVSLTAKHLESMVEKGQSYKYTLKKESHAQQQFVERLAEAFGIHENGFYASIAAIAENCRAFCVNLPNVIKEANRNNNPLIKLSSQAKAYLDCFLCFSVNPYSVLFEKLPEPFGCIKNESIDYDELEARLLEVREELSGSLSNYKTAICAHICHVFDSESNGNLSSVLTAWLAGLDAGVEQIKQLSGSFLFNALKPVIIDSLTLFDDATVVDKLAKATTAWFISDWKGDKTSELIDKIKEFKRETEQRLQSQDSKVDSKELPVNSVELSIMGKRLKKMLIMQIDSFGGALSVEEKAAILKSLLMEVEK